MTFQCLSWSLQRTFSVIFSKLGFCSVVSMFGVETLLCLSVYPSDVLFLSLMFINLNNDDPEIKQTKATTTKLFLHPLLAVTLLFNGTQKRKVKPRMKCLKQLMFVLILSFFSLKNTEFTLCESWVVTGPHRPRFWGFTAKKIHVLILESCGVFFQS